MIFNLSSVSAIGLSSLRLVEFLDFQPGLERTFEYKVGSNTDSAMYYAIYVEGNLKQYITTSVSELFIEPDKSAYFTATIKLPDNLSPGMHEGDICVSETSNKGGPSNIGVKTAACAIIYVKVLYPGKYLVIKEFNIGLADKQANFLIDVESWGTERIESAKPVVKVAEKTVEGDSVSIGSNEKRRLTAVMDVSSFNAGTYLADAKIVYDGQEANISQTFQIGDLNIRLVSYTNEFTQGKISPMDIVVESIWNQKIDNVYVDVNITKPDNEFLSYGFFQSAPASVEPWGKATLRGFFDTNGLEAMNYTARFKINFEGKFSEELGTVSVKNPTLLSPKLTVSANTILLIAILVLLLVLILLMLKRKARKKED